jgi:putative transposase
MILSTVEKKQLIDRNHPYLSVTRQCELLSLSKGALYYKPVPIDSYSLILMDLIDKQYLKSPFYGSRKMTIYLNRKGYKVNRKRVQRLMRIMGIKAIYPNRSLSANKASHPVYPYLLKGLQITRPDHVWCSDITYIRLNKGFIYLTAVMDWYSRYVLSWDLSNSLLSEFCVGALSKALKKSHPEIFNVDQGSQFTSEDFLNLLIKYRIRISMDSKGSYYDNIMIERLWRSVKYEEVYLHEYRTVRDAYQSLNAYFHFYNSERFHQRLQYRTPEEVYYQH